MTSADAVRLARAADLLDRRRARLDELSATAAGLDQLDVIVVDGERAVLAALAGELDRARALVAGLAAGTASDGTLDRIEAIVGDRCWTVLQEVHGLLADKAVIAENARTQVQPRLQEWEDVMARVEQAGREIQARHLHVVEPWELAVGRHRMTALMRQARTAARNGQLLDVWRALNRLDADPTPTADGRKPLPARRVPDELDAVTERARLSAGRLQLIALRGSTDERRVEYTLMLSAPAADRQVGINVEDRSTLVRRNHQEFLDVTRAAVTGSYRALRDVLPAAGAGAEDAGDRMAALRDMGQTLYRLLIPNRLKDEIDRHPEVPLVVVTNDREISWELMYADDFVALERPLARMPVGRFGARRSPQPPHGRRRRKVALVASAGAEIELTGAVREVDRIAAGLTAAWGEDVEIHRHVTGTRSPASGRSFDALLKSPDYDIVHYAGHAVFDRHRPDQSGLLLDHGEPCTAEKIHRLLAGSPLVFLNACETARLREPAGAPPAEGAYEGDPKEGLASAFLYGGALACIGNSWPVPDTVAADFAIAFYRWALDGRPLGEAMRFARRETARRWPDDPSWASFVLYGDPGFHLGPFASWDTGTATS